MSMSGPVLPHRRLPEHYSEDAARPAYVRGLFDDAAPHYEWINKVMSLGWGERYRRAALVAAGLTRGMCVLDIATGTGLVARAASRVVGPSGAVFGLDPSAGMLRECVKAAPISVVGARGEALPFASGRFDFVSLGYGLRHVADLRILFEECFRVLRPGGRVLILEFARPTSATGLRLGRLYLQKIIPALTRLGTRSRSAETVMRYCWDTVEHSVPPEVVLGAMSGVGLADVARKRVAGIFAEYSATRPD
jgi:demethylmenaquinone methyltransferase/2-methoxy-6-polyprenyl-1,4-benzoquinol methylase